MEPTRTVREEFMSAFGDGLKVGYMPSSAAQCSAVVEGHHSSPGMASLTWAPARLTRRTCNARKRSRRSWRRWATTWTACLWCAAAASADSHVAVGASAGQCSGDPAIQCSLCAAR